MICLESIKKQPLKKSERLSGKKLLKNILTKEETPINSNKLQAPMKCFPIQKKDNFMMTMERKESKMEDLQEVEDSEDYSTCFQEEEEKRLVDLRKANQNLFNYQ